MKKITAVLLTAGLVTLFTGCFFNPYYFDTYEVDMSAEQTASARLVRSMTATETVISNFEKYEIEILYVYIALFDTEAIPGMSYDRHTLYNVTEGSGTKVDLAVESLSDKLPLIIENPLGNAIDKIYIGIGSSVTAKGYVNHNGIVYRTRSDGTMTGDGATQDAEEGVFTVVGTEIPVESADPSNPAVQDGVKGIYLLLAAGGQKHAGHDELVFNGDGSTIDLRYPLETGLLNVNGSWETGQLEWVTPYIAETSVYEKYYLKAKDAQYYTDMMRILTDANGNAIVGQLYMGGISRTGALFNRSFGMWYDTYGILDDMTDQEIDDMYAEWFVNSDDGNSFYFKAGAEDITLNCDSFQRATHSGTFMIDGSPVEYDALKVE